MELVLCPQNSNENCYAMTFEGDYFYIVFLFCSPSA
jgi:hypothetical protein